MVERASEEKEAIGKGEETLLPLDELLSAGLHIGTRVKTGDMRRYIYRVRPDGLFIINISDTDKRIRVASKFISRFEPKKVLAVSSRLYGKTPVERFCELTQCIPLTGRFLPGLISNPLQPRHMEPELVIVTDPRADWQAVDEASEAGLPVIGLCDTDNTFAGIDLVIPVNNKGRRALAMVYWLMAKQVLIERGELPSDKTIPLKVEDFETKLVPAPAKTGSLR